nr:hypothetical protein [Tanacetum cinerariifolium]
MEPNNYWGSSSSNVPSSLSACSPYVVTRDTAVVAVAAVATSAIDDDDDTAPMDSQPYEYELLVECPIISDDWLTLEMAKSIVD